ncbi:MAG TPA: alpha/beta hydrolase [Gammaproteobacteria bacterium]|nr:alpha/beta hydrolase [Gammaproteobacteria bacterium]
MTGSAHKPRRKPKTPMALRLIQWCFQRVGSVLPGLMSRWAYRLWFSTHRYPAPAREQKLLKSATPFSVKSEGRDIQAWHWGQQGPLVLLVHGWNGRGAQLGSFVPALLKRGYQVVTFDAPGHGKTSGKNTTAFEITAAILAINEARGPLHAVITHSFGGACAAMAINRGLHVDRAVFIAPPATLEGMADAFASFIKMPDAVTLYFNRRLETEFGKNIWESISPENIVRQFKIPGLIIHDQDDYDVPWQSGERVSNAWPNAGFYKTTGLGHRRILRDKTVIDRAIDFIAS